MQRYYTSSFRPVSFRSLLSTPGRDAPKLRQPHLLPTEAGGEGCNVRPSGQAAQHLGYFQQGEARKEQGEIVSTKLAPPRHTRSALRHRLTRRTLTQERRAATGLLRRPEGPAGEKSLFCANYDRRHGSRAFLTPPSPLTTTLPQHTSAERRRKALRREHGAHQRRRGA